MNKLVSVVIIVLLATGCATSNRPSLGENATFSPGWERIKQANAKAIRDPNVWAPLVAAVALQYNDLDTQISDDLREDTPLFGSTEDALDASDDFRDYTEYAYLSTALLTPGPDDTGEWMGTKAKLIGAEWLTIEMTSRVSDTVKDATSRERPNKYSKKSMPSGHMMAAGIQAQMTELNVNHMEISDTSKQVLNLTVNSFAVLTGWARVEGGMHYPSDIAVGWALSHYLGHIATAFINPDQNIMIVPQVTEDSGAISLVLNF